MPRFIIEMEYTIEFNGSKEDAAALRDRVDDAFVESIAIHCDDTECCPGPQVEPFVNGLVGFSTFLTEEEFNKKMDEEN